MSETINDALNRWRGQLQRLNAQKGTMSASAFYQAQIRITAAIIAEHPAFNEHPDARGFPVKLLRDSEQMLTMLESD